MQPEPHRNPPHEMTCLKIPATHHAEWAEKVKELYTTGPIPRDLLPERETLERYLRDAPLGDLAAVVAATALVADADLRLGVLDKMPRSMTALGLDLVGQDDEGALVLSPMALGHLLIDAQVRLREAQAAAAGEMTFLIASVKRRERDAVHWWMPLGQGYTPVRSVAGRYAYGTILADRTRFAGGNCVVVPTYLAERIEVTSRGEVKSTDKVWKQLQSIALDLEDGDA